jgi:serine phosphatase RsbU (regulator of sigma subunit)
MGDLKAPILVLPDNIVEAKCIRAGFQSIGYQALDARSIDQLSKLCTDPLTQPIVLFSSNTPINSSSDAVKLSKLCDRYLILMAFCEPDTGTEADYFRLGVADIIEPNVQQQDLQKIIDRLVLTAEKRRRTEAHSAQLEKANNELQESLRRLEQDQKAGREVQKSLMPEGSLSFADYEISYSITPSLYLSGDFVGYNFVLDRYLLFYFADVSGHGASSAFVTVLLRFMMGRIIRRHTLEKDYAALALAPEGLVESINQQILSAGLDKHLTLVAGSLDTETRQLRYVVGAQQPSPIFITGGKARFLPGKGKPAGIFEDAKWTVEQLHVPAKFSFVLLSDGIYELLPGAQIADKEAVLLTYLDNGCESIDALKKALFIDGIEAPEDDISVLLLTGGL